MMHLYKTVSVICVSLILLLGSGSVLAQWQGYGGLGRFNIVDQLQPPQFLPAPGDRLTSLSDKSGQSGDSHGRFYGIGQPKTARDLPPGQLRKELESLPPEAKGRALGWLQNASFPAEDVKYLRVSSEGFIKFADTFVPELAGGIDTPAETLGAAAFEESQTFKLHSRPGSSNVLFLDFDGHTIEGTRWNTDGNVLVALPFDPSLNDDPPTVPNFTADELNRIAIIWHRVSEDFAGFDLDVTTEEPVVFTPTTGHVLFTHDSDASGQAMPSQNGGGTAWVGVFGSSTYVSRASPALVYYTNLSTNPAYYGVPAYNAEAASHEFGHNIGLFHDGIVDGTGYYSGHGTGLVSWAPIMGDSYDNLVTHWSNGEYPNANNTEDDLYRIAYDLGYAEDDHGNSASQATEIVVETNGDIIVSSPKLDPDNILPENKGIIGDRNDVDWFFMDVADGSINITATPAWHSWDYDNRGGNLDIELSLFDANMNLLVIAEPTDATNANLSTSVTAGRYYLQIDGVGNNTSSDYSDYSSLGMYFLEGKVQADTSDTTAPSPATMSWQTTPNATGENSFSMTSVLATDDSGSVEYYFSCVAGGNGCTDSGWQASQTWSPGGLEADTYYAYKVTARDGTGNENVASSTMGDTTDAPPPPPPPPAENIAPVAVASASSEPVLITKGKTAEVTLDGSGSSDQDGTIVSWVWKDVNGATVSTSTAFTSKLREGTYDFTLTVTDDDGAIDSTSLSVSVTKAPDEGGGGGRKPKPPKG